MSTLDGKVVVITGAGRGLGRAFAVGFAKEGAKVALVGRRLGPAGDPETLQHTARLINDLGGEAICCQGSVSDLAAMQQMVSSCVDRFGGIDILINNAGLYPPETFSEISLTQWQQVIDGYLTGAFVCSKVVAPVLIQRGGGHIINLGSNAALSDDANAFAYGTVRSATLRMTLKMAADLRRHRIAVNSYAPGFTLTEGVVEVLGEGNTRLQQAHDPEESVPHVLWIARQAPDLFTGNVVFLEDWGQTWGPGATSVGFPGPETTSVPRQ